MKLNIYFCLVIVFFVASCSDNGGENVRSDSEENGQSKIIRIIDPIEANNLHVPIAKSRGLFKKNRLNVEVTGTSAGKFAMDALLGGSVNYAVVVDTNIAHALFNRDDLVVLAELAEPTTAIKLLARKDHGVSAASDMNGKKIGVLYGVNIHLFAQKYIKKHNLKDVEIINLAPPQAVAAFESGDIDATIIWQPHAFKINKRLGEEKISVLEENSRDFWSFKMVLVTTKAYYSKNKEEATNLLKALIEADDIIQAEQDYAAEVLSNHLNMDKEDTFQFFDEIEYRVKISEKLLEMIEYELDWLKKPPFDKGKSKVQDIQTIIAPNLKQIDITRWELKGPADY